jgi:SAM-dependent methyltransferase
MTLELDQVTVKKAYARWAPVYDLVFGKLFDRGRQAAVAAAEQVGGRILEVGVGTGISLPGYSPGNRIVGIDLSEPMLRKARERVAQMSLTNVVGLEAMDAEHLSSSPSMWSPQSRTRRLRSMSLPASFGLAARSSSPIGSEQRSACVGQLKRCCNPLSAVSVGEPSFPGVDSLSGSSRGATYT